MKRIILISLFFLLDSISSIASADSLRVDMYMTAPNGKGQAIGTVIATDTKYGLLLIPDLHGLPPGIHGFHVHAGDSCEHNGDAAGAHLDPKNTGNHLGPYDDKGHLGDLPALTVTSDGVANLPILAPRLKVKKLQGHAFIIHAGADNYADVPEKMGGGGARIACGIITQNIKESK